MNARILPSQSTPGSRSPRPAINLAIGGVTPFTTIDFPGRLAAVLYTQGCTWRCAYCHNSHLWPARSDSPIPFQKILDFLEARKDFLDGVVFSGGEPTIHEGLPEAMLAVRQMGFRVGLHTTGMHPQRLRSVLQVCDWVGMDIKAPFDSYHQVTQIPRSGTGPRESVGLLLASGVDCEFRTTVHPQLLSEKQILEIAGELSAKGARRFVLQAFHARGCVDETLKSKPLAARLISDESLEKLTGLFRSFEIRN